MTLTEQRERNPKDEDHDAAEERQQKVAGGHDPDDKQGGILLLEVLDHGFVLSGPHGAHEDQSHHRSAQEHAKRVQEPTTMEHKSHTFLYGQFTVKQRTLPVGPNSQAVSHDKTDGVFNLGMTSHPLPYSQLAKRRAY